MRGRGGLRESRGEDSSVVDDSVGGILVDIVVDIVDDDCGGGRGGGNATPTPHHRSVEPCSS